MPKLLQKSSFSLKSLNLVLDLLPRKDKRKFILATVSQSLLGILDLIGIGLSAILGALAVRGVQSKAPGKKVESVLNLIRISNQSFHFQIIVLATSTLILLLSKTLISMFVLRKTLSFLGHKSAALSNQVIFAGLRQDSVVLEDRGSQNLMYAFGVGVSNLVIGILGTFMTLFSDLFLLIIIFAGILVIDPVMAISTFLLFGSISIILFYLMKNRTTQVAEQLTQYSILSNSLMTEVLTAYREITVRGRIPFYAEILSEYKRKISKLSSDQALFPNISKYAIEISITLGAFIVSASVFLRSDASHAIASLTLFIAAGSRVAPALLRIQQGALTIKSNTAMAQPTIKFINEIGIDLQPEKEFNISSSKLDLSPEIEVRGLSFQYLKKSNFRLDIDNLKVERNSLVALVGPSGGGKTTLVDLIMGIHLPNSGKILINGINPRDYNISSPGNIGYVPQNVAIFSGSVRQNIGLGFSDVEIDDDLVFDSLRKAKILEFFKQQPNGLLTQVGERGVNLSGGQKQRIGIARALYLKPKLLILDEATSSLDANTEYDISRAIEELRDACTVIIIAHRLSTVKFADKVIYLEAGRIVASGSFDDVRKQVPNFDEQAKLMGL